MKTEIPYRPIWWLVALVWNPGTFLMVGFFGYLLLSDGIQRPDPLRLSAGTWLVLSFLFAALIASLFVVSPAYPWYLANKASESTSWQDYWFQKFQYRLGRYIHSSFRSERSDVLARIHLARMAKQLDKKVVEESEKGAKPEGAPGIDDLLRSFLLRTDEIRRLAPPEDRPKMMGAETARLTASVQGAGSLEEAYLRYLGGAYLALEDYERSIVSHVGAESFWGRMDRSPTWSRVLFLLTVAIIVILRLLGISL